MVTKRLNILWTVLGVVGGMALGGWYAGSRIQSPAEVAARTAPPEPSPILVPVESRVLSSEIVTRGTVRFGLPQPISIVPSALKGGIGLIAALPRPNTGFREGEVILAVSGRPVFVLRGESPTFRDMSPGTRGGDVRQLEEALARLGFDPGPVDGIYDQRTSTAVERWYRSSGREPFGPTREQRAAIIALERDLSDAVRGRLAADADVAAQTGERALIVLDPRQTKTARATVEARLKTAQFDRKAMGKRAERLEREYAAARERLGFQVPADEVIFLPALPVRVHEVSASVGANASGSVMSVTDNQLSIDSRLPIETAPLVRAGMRVAVDEQALGVKTTGVVETVANTPGTHGADGYHFYLGVRLESSPARNLAGLSVRLTIPIETTKGVVTVVPTSALWLAADGTTRLRVKRGGGLEYVTVQPGLSTGGYVEVTAPDAQLIPGELVVVSSKTPEVR